MKTLLVILFLTAAGGYIVARKILPKTYLFLSLEPYAGSENHMVMTVLEDGFLTYKTQKYISGSGGKEWFRCNSGTVNGKQCSRKTEKSLQKIYSANKGRLDFDEKYPTAHLG